MMGTLQQTISIEQAPNSATAAVGMKPAVQAALVGRSSRRSGRELLRRGIGKFSWQRNTRRSGLRRLNPTRSTEIAGPKLQTNALRKIHDSMAPFSLHRASSLASEARLGAGGHCASDA